MTPTRTPLFPDDEVQELRSRWDSVQASFVDEPRRAVEEADNLVATAMKRLPEQFAGERDNLEAQWDKGGDISTEDLRLAMQRYRSFFGRLLSRLIVRPCPAARICAAGNYGNAIANSLADVRGPADSDR